MKATKRFVVRGKQVTEKEARYVRRVEFAKWFGVEFIRVTCLALAVICVGIIIGLTLSLVGDVSIPVRIVD